MKNCVSNTMQRKLVWSAPLGIVFLATAVLMSVIDFVQIFTTHNVKIYNGSGYHVFLTKPIDAIHISVYLFNITNADRFLSGEDQKLKVEEVGPFTYREMRYNENIEIDDKAGLVRYEPRIEKQFVPEESVAHPDNVTVTLPNMVMLGLTTTLSTFPYWTRMGFNILTNQLNSKAMVTLKASEYIWGYSDPLLSLTHKLVPGYVNFEKLGILDRLYDTETPNRLEVGSRGETKMMIRTRNGLKKLPMGKLENVDDCEICDNFTNAYEGLGYPSPISPETPINVFKNGLCRIIPMVFHKKVVLNSGTEGFAYNLSESFFSLDPNVTKNRMLDLSTCFYGIPFVITKVYFLGLDKEIYDHVEGLPKPDPRKETYMIIEPKVGLQLETYVPVQMNLRLGDLSFNKKASRFSNMVVPMGYLEIIQPPLPKETKEILEMIYVIIPVRMLVSKVVLIMIAIGLILCPVVNYFLQKRIKKQCVLMAQKPLL